MNSHSKVLVLTSVPGKLGPCPASSQQQPPFAFKTDAYLKDAAFSCSIKKKCYAVLKDSPVHWIIVQDKSSSQSVAIKSKCSCLWLALDYWYSRRKDSFKYRNKNSLLKRFSYLQKAFFLLLMFLYRHWKRATKQIPPDCSVRAALYLYSELPHPAWFENFRFIKALWSSPSWQRSECWFSNWIDFGRT